MRKVALIYNPMSGQPRRRAAQIEAAMAALRAAGVCAEAIATTGPGTAGRQARQAIESGCDTVLSCGGDGTAHEVLQGMVGTEAVMGVIPLGTANSLAIDLGIPRDPAAAVRLLLKLHPTRIAVGRMEYQCRQGQPEWRYFTVAAGIGPDAHLFYTLGHGTKRRFGYVAYYLKAMSIWATHRYPLFEVEFTPTGSTVRFREMVSQVLAVRITNFGGMLRRLAPGAALRRADLRLVLFKTRSRLRYLQYMTSILMGRVPNVREIELIDATSAVCRPVPREPEAERIYAEADGELLGVLPSTLTIETDAVTLLMRRR